MNTDKIYAEQLANEYAPKDTSGVIALRKLDDSGSQNRFAHNEVIAVAFFLFAMSTGY